MRVRTVEQTGKCWKAYGCFGYLLVLVSIGLTIAAYSGAGHGFAIAAGACIFPGAVFMLIGRLGAWWYHG